MVYIFSFISQTVLFIFLFDRTILSNKKYLWYFIFGGILLFGLGFLFEDIKGGNALKIPIIQWVSYKILIWLIVKFYGQEPKDTFWSNDLSLMKDGFLNVLIWFVAFGLPTMLVLNKF